MRTSPFRFASVIQGLLVLAVGTVLPASPASVFAQPSWNWTGQDPSPVWSAPSNWQPNAALPNDGSAVAVFGAGSTSQSVANGPWHLHGIRLASGGSAMSITGSPLTLGAGGLAQDASAPLSIAQNIALSADQTWRATGGSLTVEGSVHPASQTLTVEPLANRTLDFQGGLVGPGAVTKQGAGTLRLGAPGSFTGSIRLSAGTLSLAHPGALGSGQIALRGGTLVLPGTTVLDNPVRLGGTVNVNGGPLTFHGPRVELEATSTLNHAQAIQMTSGLRETGGSRSFTKTGAGLLTISGPPQLTGTLAIRGGTVALDDTFALPDANLQIGGGVLALAGEFTLPLGTGPRQLRFLNHAGFSARGGDLTLAIPGGPLTWGQTPHFLAHGHRLVLNNGTANANLVWSTDLNFGTANREIQSAGPASTRASIQAVLSGSGGLIRTGTGILALEANNTFTGPVALHQGVTEVPSLAPVGQPSPLGAGSGANAPILLGTSTQSATLRYTGSGHSTDRPLHLNGSTGGATLDASGSGPAHFTGGAKPLRTGAKTLTLLGTGQGILQGAVENGPSPLTLAKTGDGSWTLTGPNTFTGGVTLSRGRLIVAGNAALGTGTLRWNGGALSASISPVTLANPVLLGGSVSLAAGPSLSFTGLLTLSGNRTLTNNNINAPTEFHQIDLSNSGSIRTLTLHGPGHTIVHGPIRNGGNASSGNLTKNGPGSLTLTGPNLYTGATTLLAGTLTVLHPLALGTPTVGTSVRNGATLALQGSFALDEPLNLNGTGVGQAGALHLSGGSLTLTRTVVLGGNTRIVANGGSLLFAPATGNAVQGSRSLALHGSGHFTFNRPIDTRSGLTKSGSGTVTLISLPHNTGPIVVQEGTLVANGTITAATTTVRHHASLGGSARLSGSLTFEPGARLLHTIGQEPLSAVGTIVLGNLHVTLEGTLPPLPATLPVLRGGSFTGLPGTVQAPPGATATLRLVGNTLVADLVPSVPPVPPSTQWLIDHFGTANPVGPAAWDADPDADGLPNLLEFALGRQPLVSDAEGAVRTLTVEEAGQTFLALRFTRAAEGVSYLIEASSNLQSWTETIPVPPGPVGQEITVRDTEPVGHRARRFLRLRASLNP